MEFDPLVAEWFSRAFRRPTPVQRDAWEQLAQGRDVLISAPTGSGKTLAAFLTCLDELVSKAIRNSLEDSIHVVYVSPLKALSNDIQKNLERPLAEIRAMGEDRGLSIPQIRVALRTGDTPPSQRQAMVRKPPHILVTTPESLFILLTSEKSRLALRSTRCLILDEIHAVVDDKRGAHLALSVARLDNLVRQAGLPSPRRIGLSATVNPIDDVARFLKPDGEVRVVDHGHQRTLDLKVQVPEDALGPLATNELWTEIYDRIARDIEAHRTTLIFVNTRRLSERVAHALAERLGASRVLAHHGSLSRERRLEAEELLRQGLLRAVVATASLELGIDIGSIELVIQIGSPRAVTVALQRVGRSGHRADPSSIPKGRLIPTTRDELVECAALVRAIRKGCLDRLRIPEWPRDVLAQQVVAAVASEPWSESDLYELVKSTWSYRDLPRSEFDAIIRMLAEGIATDRGRSGAYLHRDMVNSIVQARRGARLAAITSGGAIPDNASYYVIADPEETIVGSVDEDFAVESMAGDVFLLGTTSWRIRRVESGQVRVQDAQGAAPSIPFWRGEAPGRSLELSREVARLRQDAGTQDNALSWLMEDCGLNQSGAQQAIRYLKAGQTALGGMPTDRTVIAERFFDEGGGMQLVIHAPFGARVNRAWGLALRKRFCRTFNFELQAAATDNGIVISLGEQHSFPLAAVFEFLDPDTVEDVLIQALLPAPMFAARWRWNASRALAVLRFARGRKVPPPLQRMRSDDLLAAVFPDQAACGENLAGDIRIPEHPLVSETIRDCLHEAMDVDELETILGDIASGKIEALAVDTAEPSPFSHEILNANPYAFLDDAPLEERRARAVQLGRTLAVDVGELGALDPAAIQAVREESWPVVRDAEELHDALLTLVALPHVRDWSSEFRALVTQRRATEIQTENGTFWVAAERLATAQLLYPTGTLKPVIDAFEVSPATDADQAATWLVRGWLESRGPETVSRLATQLGQPQRRIEGAMGRLESTGEALRGRFTPTARLNPHREIEWCNRRVLARIHRLTLGKLRREIEPVSPAVFMRFLFSWQHVAAGTRLHGDTGTLQIIRQLQGYEVPAAAWEASVLPERIAQYSPQYLDELCLRGEIMWGRLSPHPSFTSVDTEAGPRRVRPTRVAPVALFLREDANWILPEGSEPALERLSHPAREIFDALREHGASFLRELVQATRRLTSEVEDGLWELTAAGLVTADGFDNLRALIDPKRRRGEGRGRAHRPRHASGRWALLTRRVETLSVDQRGEACARQLLHRWGIVFRDLIAREALRVGWRELLIALRRMEARGEVRGGRFVSGFPGEQFALPEAIDLVRSLRRNPSDEPLRITATDPLNLAGIITPGPRSNPLTADVVDLLAG